MTSLLPSFPRRMLLYVIWFGLFLDVLDSFLMPPPFRLPRTTRNAKIDSDTRTTTAILIPPASPQASDDSEYPSPLHYIYVRSILTPDQAQTCCEIAQEYARQTGCWKTPDGKRHVSFPTCDFPVEDCESLQEYLNTIDFDTKLFSSLSELYGVDVQDMEYLDLFVAHYQAKTDGDDDDKSSGMMDQLELHRDGSLLSFSLLLNLPDAFEGGGTFYDALRDADTTDIVHEGGVIRPLQAGDACLHCGKILHGADKVMAGFRTVLVGFVDVHERNIRPGVLAKACTEWGRMDVASYRHRRQVTKGNIGWVLNNERLLPKCENPPFVKGFVPAFASVERRAKSEYQRQKKLQAEDVLLRTMLLPPDERPEAPILISWDDDSISVL